MINVQLLIRELSYSYINGDSGQCRKMSVKNSNLKKNVCLLLIKTGKKNLCWQLKQQKQLLFFLLQTFYINSKVSLCQECQEMAARIRLKWLR